MISWDLETDLIDRAYLAPDPVCVSWAPAPQVLLIGDAHDMIRDWFASDTMLVGTNLAFDMACLMQKWPHMRHAIFMKVKRGQVQSVDVNQKLIDLATRGECDGSYSLETLCERYRVLSPDKSGPWRKEYSRLRHVPVADWPQGAVDYVLGDAQAPLTIAERQHEYDRGWSERTGGHAILHLAGFEQLKALCFYLMSCEGVHTHRDRTTKFRNELRAHLDECLVGLREAGLVRPEGSKDTKKAKALMETACQELGIPVPLTKTGLTSLDEEACEGSGSELLALYSDFSLSGTYMARAEDMMQGFELPLQSRFNPLLETGRSSSSKPKPPVVGIQTQNMPKKLGVRECLDPGPGHLFLAGDLPMAELYSLAQFCIDRFGHSTLAEVLNSGKDVHTFFAAALLGTTYEALLERVKAGDADAVKARDLAKIFNYGAGGGMGAPTFTASAWRQARLRLAIAEVKRNLDLWRATFPEMTLFFRWVGKQTDNPRQRGLVRHLRSGRWRANCTYCALANTQFQELTGCAAMSGFCEIVRRCYSEPDSWLWNSRPALFTHDENVFKVPEARGHEAAMEFKDVMITEFNKWHPDVPIKKLDVVLTRVYTKKMKPTWREGRLVAA